MKFIDEYRDGESARRLARAIRRITTRPHAIMEICGGQTHSIVKFGIDELLPPEITLIHGPGCPVCVTPIELIDKAVELAARGVQVNAVSPGPVDTDQSRGTHTPATRRAYLDRIPQKRYGETREIAAAVVFLASPEASFISGHVLNVDGGFDAAGLIFDDLA